MRANPVLDQPLCPVIAPPWAARGASASSSSDAASSLGVIVRTTGVDDYSIPHGRGCDKIAGLLVYHLVHATSCGRWGRSPFSIIRFASSIALPFEARAPRRVRRVSWHRAGAAAGDSRSARRVNTLVAVNNVRGRRLQYLLFTLRYHRGLWLAVRVVSDLR